MRRMTGRFHSSLSSSGTRRESRLMEPCFAIQIGNLFCKTWPVCLLCFLFAWFWCLLMCICDLMIGLLRFEDSNAFTWVALEDPLNTFILGFSYKSNIHFRDNLVKRVGEYLAFRNTSAFILPSLTLHLGNTPFFQLLFDLSSAHFVTLGIKPRALCMLSQHYLPVTPLTTHLPFRESPFLRLLDSSYPWFSVTGEHALFDCFSVRHLNYQPALLFASSKVEKRPVWVNPDFSKTNLRPSSVLLTCWHIASCLSLQCCRQSVFGKERRPSWFWKLWVV